MILYNGGNPVSTYNRAIKLACMGIGAAAAGPIGLLCGTALPTALDGQIAEYIKKALDAGSGTFSNVVSNFIYSHLEHGQPDTDQLRLGLQEALRRALSKLWVDSKTDPRLTRYRDWFDHWDRRLAAKSAIEFPSSSDIRDRAKRIAASDGEAVKIILPLLPKIALEGRALGARWYENIFRKTSEEDIPYELGILLESELAKYLEPEVTRVLSADKTAWVASQRIFQSELRKELGEIKTIVQETGVRVQQIGVDVISVKGDVHFIKEQLARLIQQQGGVAVPKYPEARTCFVQLRLKPEFSHILSNLADGARFLDRVESLPAQFDSIKALGAWGPSAPVYNRQARNWAHVAHILTAEAREILMSHLRKLPEVQAAQLDTLTEEQEADLLPSLMTMARFRQREGDAGPFLKGFAPWRAIAPDPAAGDAFDDMLFPGGKSSLNPETGSPRFRQLLAEEATIPRRGMLERRAQFATKAKQANQAGEITKAELDHLDGLNRRHALGMD